MGQYRRQRAAAQMRTQAQPRLLIWLDGASYGCLLTALFLAPLLLGRFDLASRAIFEACVVVSLGAFLLRAAGRGELRTTPTPLTLPLAAFVVWEGLSILGSVNRYASLTEGLRVLGAGALTWRLLQERDHRRVQGALAALLLSGLVVAGRGLREYVATAVWGGDPRWAIFVNFFNPNCLAAFLLVVLPLAAGLLWFWHSRHPVVVWLEAREVQAPVAKLRFLGGLALLVLLAALVLTRSRGGLLAGAVAGGVYLWGLVRAKRLRPRTFALLAATALLGGTVLLLGPLRTALQASLTAQQHSHLFRLLTWRGTWEMFCAHPLFGTGAGTFPYIYLRYAQAGFTQMAHNSFLQIAAEGGLVALLAFLWLGGVMGREALRALGALRDPLRQAVGLATLSALVGFTLHNLLDYGWYVPAVAVSLLALGGSLAALAQTPPDGVVIMPLRRRWPWSAALISVLLLAGWMSLSTVLALGEQHARAGEVAFQRGDYYTAEWRYEQAVRLMPWNGDYLRELAELYARRAAATGDERLHQRAFALLQRARTLQPTHARNYYELGQWYENLADWPQAIAAYRRALELDPHRTRLWLALGRVQEAAGDPEGAALAYERAIAWAESPAAQANPLPEYFVDTAYAEALYRLARLDLTAGRWPSAYKNLLQAQRVLDTYFAQRAAREREIERSLSPEASPTEKQLLLAQFGYYPEADARLQALRDEIAELLEARLEQKGSDP